MKEHKEYVPKLSTPFVQELYRLYKGEIAPHINPKDPIMGFVFRIFAPDIPVAFEKLDHDPGACDKLCRIAETILRARKEGQDEPPIDG